VADVGFSCPQCGHRWFVPADMALGPTQEDVRVAARKAKNAARVNRKRKRFEAGLVADQALATAQARRCPRCGAGGLHDAPASWQPDPWSAADERWWDGRQWTGQTR